MDNNTITNSELGDIFLHLETLLHDLNNQALLILNRLSPISTQEFKKLPFQIEKDLKNIHASTLNEQYIISELLSLLPSIKKDPELLMPKLSIVRHQLRTYINAIKGYAEFITEEMGNSEILEIRAMIARLSSLPHITKKMLSLIDDLIIPEEISQKLEKKALIKSEMITQNSLTKTSSSLVPVALPKLNTALQKNANVMELFQQLSRKAKSDTIKEKGTILVVDDIPTNRMLLESWLLRKQYTVFGAASGMEAMALLDRYANIDIMLLDVMMPIMDGYEVLKHVKGNDRFADLIVIMISALDEEESIVNCIKEGAEDYLIKPFNPFLLDVKIKACLDKKRLRDTEKAYISALFDELNFAQQIQLSMMPTQEPITDLCRIYGQVIPAKEIGGDFYDWHRISKDKFSLCIGDVSGKGASAALYMVQMRTILITLATIYTNMPEQLEKFLTHTNQLQCKDNESSMFVTLFYGILDITSGQFDYVNAGHCPPIIKDSNGDIKVLEGLSGLPMGVFDKTIYKSFRTTLEKDSMLILYTDGITEAMNSSGEMYGIERLKKIIRDDKIRSPQEMVSKVINSVVAFTDNRDAIDDITILIKWLAK